MNRASADVGLIMTAYNFRRIINILGINTLKEYLRMVLDFVSEKTVRLKLRISNIKELVTQIKNIIWISCISLKRLYLIQNLTVEIGF